MDSKMPTPKSPSIAVSEQQKEVLSKIARQSTADFREVSRASLILEIEKGKPNSRIAKIMSCSIDKVKHWRYKWLANQDTLTKIESGNQDTNKLVKSIREFLKDNPRPGAPPTYSSEQYCQILAVALEHPEESGRPISQWTSRELADECNKRGITSGIPDRQVGRFLKRNRCETPS
ncbi:MAG: helix-turn-helix domain-containing protein [Candidatus Electrothrix sp. EH2]|nr:helix-turn-helix domain-containing protein [Candidatus Electrothrix sp. EH2]